MNIGFIFTTGFFYSIIRITTPILFATLAAVIGEKGGVSNIGLEGIMMLSALFGSVTAAASGSWAAGVAAALLIGILTSLLMGFFAFNLRTDIILTGTAVNMIGSGGCLFLCNILTEKISGSGQASTTALIVQKLQIPSWKIPGLSSIPVIGQIFSGHCILTYLAFLFVWFTWILLYKTPLGLNIRSVGENPNAASSVGVSVLRIKYITIGFTGLLAGFGGAFMSMYYSMGWSQDMVAGRGFIALAAQAMGGGEPAGSMLAALVFGFAQALGIKVSSKGADSNLVSTMPYLVTIAGLVVFALIARSREKKRHSSSVLKE